MGILLDDPEKGPAVSCIFADRMPQPSHPGDGLMPAPDGNRYTAGNVNVSLQRLDALQKDLRNDKKHLYC